jgi:hypothetical protein
MKRLLTAVSVLALAACTDATGSLEGGDPLFGSGSLGADASVGPVDAAACDAQLIEAGEPDAQLTAYCTAAKGTRGSGITYTDLYRDFFNNVPGGSSCTQASNCHVPLGTGAQTRWLCGSTQADCYAGMTGSGIVPQGGTLCSAKTPDQIEMYKALRKSPPAQLDAGTYSGLMPYHLPFAFCPEDLSRIYAWIANGAKND